MPVPDSEVTVDLLDQSTIDQPSSDGRTPLFDDLKPNKSRLARLYLLKHERKEPVLLVPKVKTLADLGMKNLANSEQEEVDLLNFLQADRNYLVMTNAGKPVYCYKGDV